MKISEEQRALLEKQWIENGACRSCGWHSAYYEVAHVIERAFLENDFQEDGSIHIICFADNSEDTSSHRGSNIYDFKLHDDKI